MGRRWPVLVLILFCLPLFFGLRSADLETDEAIYSYAVDRIVEGGEWLVPVLSPFDNEPFLEKPPLKFWIVAPAIKAGLLPDDELGFRFWDAAMGGLAFLYVFAIGALLAGPVCGLVAVFVLFVHWPLLLQHGIRGNNMEAPLLLAYCGGVYHFLRWSAFAPAVLRRDKHAWAAGLYFVLGFMTKFVAVIFLPAFLGLAALLFTPTRQALVRSWRQWLAVAAGVLVLVAPWFVYAQIRFGGHLWRTILGEHVYARFTVGLDRNHLEPWTYYYVNLWNRFGDFHTAWLVAAGFAVLIVQTIRRRSFIGAVIVLWAVLPIALISLGSSKLYHYAYPFLPPLALGGGYLVALVMMLAPVQVRKAAEWIEDAIARHVPRLSALASNRTVQRVATAIIWVSAGLAIAALLFGTVRIGIGRTLFFKNSQVLRPAILILGAAILTRRSARVAVLLVALAVGAELPLPAYADIVARLRTEHHPLRDVTACIRRVDAEVPGGRRGMFVDSDDTFWWHPVYFYFRRVQPWTRQIAPAAAALDPMLHDPAVMRPSLIMERRYRDYLAGPEAVRFTATRSTPNMDMIGHTLLLPGPYAACSPEGALANATTAVP